MILEREYVELALKQVKLHPRNARHGDVGAISESIEAVGFTAPIIVQRSTGMVIAGNHRVKAARDLGMKTIPAMVIDVDDATAAKIAIGDNRIAQLATWDEQVLLEQLEALAVEADLFGTGYDLDDLDSLLGRGPGHGSPQTPGHSGGKETGSDTAGSSPAEKHTVLRTAVYSRKGVSWLACRAWRSDAYKAGIQALKEAKDECALEWVQRAAEDVEAVAVAVLEALDLDAVISTTPARDAAFKGGAHFASEVAKMIAGRIGRPFDGALFAPRAADRKGHHPRREKEPPEVNRAPASVLLIDDMTTSGETVELCVKALREKGSRVSTLVWISGKVGSDVDI